MIRINSVMHILTCKYPPFNGREEVRRMLMRLDPEGVAQRRRHRLNRRQYYSKVILYTVLYIPLPLLYYIIYIGTKLLLAY